MWYLMKHINLTCCCGRNNSLNRLIVITWIACSCNFSNLYHMDWFDFISWSGHFGHLYGTKTIKGMISCLKGKVRICQLWSVPRQFNLFELSSYKLLHWNFHECNLFLNSLHSAWKSLFQELTFWGNWFASPLAQFSFNLFFSKV